MFRQTSTTRSSTTTNPSLRQFLPESFQPSSHDVIVGRGREVYWHSGNIAFRQIIIAHLQKYAEAKTKGDKSRLIEWVMYYIRCQESGDFVKKCLETNRWYEIGDDQAKEKISQTFRDFLHEHYASSNETRKKVRRGKGVKYNRKQAANKTYTTVSLGDCCAAQPQPQPSSSISSNNKAQDGQHMLQLEPLGDFDMYAMLMDESFFPTTTNNGSSIIDIDQQQTKKEVITPTRPACNYWMMDKTNPSYNPANMEATEGASAVSQCLQLMQSLPNNSYFQTSEQQQVTRPMTMSALGSSLAAAPTTKTTSLPLLPSTTVPSTDGVSARFLSVELDADEKALLTLFAFS